MGNIKRGTSPAFRESQEKSDGSSVSSVGSVRDETNTGESTLPLEERDEVREVEKITIKDTRRLHFWRFVVTFIILLTALAVTFTTYLLLQHEQRENFESAVRGTKRARK